MTPGSLGLPKRTGNELLDDDGFGFAPAESAYTLLLAPWGWMRKNQTSRDPANTPFF